MCTTVNAFLWSQSDSCMCLKKIQIWGVKMKQTLVESSADSLSSSSCITRSLALRNLIWASIPHHTHTHNTWHSFKWTTFWRSNPAFWAESSPTFGNKMGMYYCKLQKMSLLFNFMGEMQLSHCCVLLECSVFSMYLILSSMLVSLLQCKCLLVSVCHYCVLKSLS